MEMYYNCSTYLSCMISKRYRKITFTFHRETSFSLAVQNALVCQEIFFYSLCGGFCKIGIRTFCSQLFSFGKNTRTQILVFSEGTSFPEDGRCLGKNAFNIRQVAQDIQLV